jgi:hypothetical protein
MAVPSLTVVESMTAARAKAMNRGQARRRRRRRSAEMEDNASQPPFVDRWRCGLLLRRF